MKKIYTPTLVLGLGGTGFQIVSQIKKVADEYGAKDNKALKFLCLDFDSFSANDRNCKSLFQENSLLDKTNEYVHLSMRDIDTPYKKNIKERHYEWFESTNDSERISELLNRVDSNLNFQDGCGQTRINGKIAVSHSDYWRIANEKLNSALKEISNSQVEGAELLTQLRVFVYCSTAGASGSGLVLDTLFMLMKNTIGKLFKLYDFIVLPDAYISQYGESAVRPRLALPNTYGLLNEIDYLEDISYAFSPTNFTDAQVDILRQNERKSPQHHFLVNNEIFKGASNFSMSGLYSAIARFSWNMVEPGFASQEKNFKTESASNKGKKGIFGSIGYTELVFNFETVKSYFLQQLLAKASPSKARMSNTNHKSANNASWHNGLTQIKEICEKSDINFLKADYTDKINGINFDRPFYNDKKYFSTLKDKVSSNVNSYKQEIKAVVDSDFVIPESFIKAKKELLSNLKYIDEKEFENRKLEITNQIESLICTLTEDEKNQLSDKNTSLSSLIDNNLSGTPKKGSKWLNGFPKNIFYGRIKKSFYTEQLKKVLIRVDTTLGDIKTILAKQFLYERVNNSLQELKQDVQNTSYLHNIQGLNLVKGIISKSIDLSSIKGTSICLESYLKNTIDEIVKEIEIGDEDYMKCVNSNTKEEVYKVLENKFSEINVYKTKTINEILNDINEQSRQDINSKLGDLKSTFWDRDDDDIIKEGQVQNRKGFEVHSWENIDNHRHSYYSLELGIAGHNVRNIRKYKQEYEDVLDDRGKEEAVKYFGYDEIKLKLNHLLDDSGLYNVQDKDKLQKRARALDIWSQGWALGIIQLLSNNRYRFHLGTDFKPADEYKSLLNSGIYDLYKNQDLGLNIVRMFDIFQNDEPLLEYIEAKIQEARNKDPREFLEKVKNQFDETTTSIDVNRYRTQKKAYSKLCKKGNEKEYEFVKEEGQVLEVLAEQFAAEKGIDVKFYDEPSKNDKGGQFRRVKFI